MYKCVKPEAAALHPLCPAQSHGFHITDGLGATASIQPFHQATGRVAELRKTPDMNFNSCKWHNLAFMKHNCTYIVLSTSSNIKCLNRVTANDSQNTISDCSQKWHAGPVSYSWFQRKLLDKFWEKFVVCIKISQLTFVTLLRYIRNWSAGPYLPTLRPQK